MNIFAFDKSPTKSALWLDDVRKNKMIVESNQLMSMVMDKLDPTHGYDMCGYPKSMLKHPCTLWTRMSSPNFFWLLTYTEALISQRGKPHASAVRTSRARQWFCDGGADIFPHKYLTPFANCAANQSVGVSFKHILDVHAAYRLYINERWKLDTIKLSWKYGEQPHWRMI